MHLKLGGSVGLCALALWMAPAARAQTAAGPEAVVADGQTADVDCLMGMTVRVQGGHNTVKVEGTCDKVTIVGSDNDVTVDEGTPKVVITGSRNKVALKGTPAVSNKGSNNDVHPYVAPTE